MAGLNTDKLIEIQKQLDSSDPKIRSKEIGRIMGGGRTKFLKVKTEGGVVYICGRQCHKQDKKWCGRVFLCPMEVFGHTDDECIRTEVNLPHPNLPK